ncbi:hypothetical protein MNBD_PLANCTO03-1320, partial [hydrothermal vent metagenome]
MRNHPRIAMTLCLASLLCVAGCDTPPTASPSQDTARPAVEQFGAMRAVMRQGQTESRISLAEAVAAPHAFAVGALEGLAGEIMIVDSEVWVSRPTDDGLEVTGPALIADDQATLLTLTHVANWHSVPIETAAEGDALESLIEQTAKAQGIDTTEPFPFLLEGRLTSLDIHVINGYCPIATDPATIDAQPWHLANTQPVDVVIVGFYAPDAAGVMTHHGTSVHAHAVLTIDGTTLTGHVDRFAVEPGMTLR